MESDFPSSRQVVLIFHTIYAFLLGSLTQNEKDCDNKIYEYKEKEKGTRYTNMVRLGI